MQSSKDSKDRETLTCYQKKQHSYYLPNYYIFTSTFIVNKVCCFGKYFTPDINTQDEYKTCKRKDKNWTLFTTGTFSNLTSVLSPNKTKVSTKKRTFRFDSTIHTLTSHFEVPPSVTPRNLQKMRNPK